MPVFEIQHNGKTYEVDAPSIEAAASAFDDQPKQPMPAVPAVGGIGGYNPLARRFMGAGEQGMERLGLTPENVQNPVANALGPLETAAQVGTGTAGTIAGGIAGIAQAMRNIGSRTPAVSAADRVSQVQQAMTYQPRTGVGAGMSRVVSLPGEAYGAVTNRAGEIVTDATGSPSLGAAIKTAGDMAPAVVGMRTSKWQRPQVQPKRTGSYQLTNDKGPVLSSPVRQPDVPATSDLAAARTAAYKAVEDAGVVIKPQSTQRVVNLMDLIAKKENLGKLPPKIKDARDVLAERIDSNTPLSLNDADKVRQLIDDAFKSTDATDRRLAQIIKNRYDDYLDNLTPADILSGDATQGVGLLKNARMLHKRYARSKMFDEIEIRTDITGDVNYSQAGQELALRREFAKIAKDPDEMSKYTPEEQAAIRAVAKPGGKAKALVNLGKMDPARGGMASALSTGVGGGLGGIIGATFGGPAGAGAGAIAGNAALGTAAHIANRKALGITRGNVQKARETLVGRGLSSEVPRATAPTTQPSAARPRTPEEVKARVQAKSLEKVQADIQRLLAEAERLQAELGSARQGGSRDK